MPSQILEHHHITNPRGDGDDDVPEPGSGAILAPSPPLTTNGEIQNMGLQEDHLNDPNPPRHSSTKMDFSKLSLICQVEIESPCPEDWDSMSGDEARRFCAGCGCHVHNLAQIPASEAEQLLTQPDRVCARITVDAKKGILTRDGWIPRLLAAGALAATAAGCTPTVTTGDPSISSIGQTIASAPTKKSTPVTITQKTKPKDKKPVKKKTQVLVGDVSPGLPPAIMGKMAVPVTPPKTKDSQE